jgi:hypothetical protein
VNFFQRLGWGAEKAAPVAARIIKAHTAAARPAGTRCFSIGVMYAIVGRMACTSREQSLFNRKERKERKGKRREGGVRKNNNVSLASLSLSSFPFALFAFFAVKWLFTIRNGHIAVAARGTFW